MLASQVSVVPMPDAVPLALPSRTVALSSVSAPRSSRLAPAPVSTMLPGAPPAPVTCVPSVRVTAAPEPERFSVPA